jgi:hypothetical protein
MKSRALPIRLRIILSVGIPVLAIVATLVLLAALNLRSSTLTGAEESAILMAKERTAAARNFLI